VTVLNPVQARANDLSAVKAQAAAGRMALQGGVDSHLLTIGTPDQVRRETLRVLAILAPGGGYLLGPDQGMPWPVENYHAMLETARAYGRYPLNLPD
ncbi:MAG: uroporphyrinogen decarboxylase family protein, partial [Chloroflexota bacterium]